MGPGTRIQQFLFVGLLFVAHNVLAGVANLPFSSCFGGAAADELSIDTVYAQVLGQPGDYFMNLTVVGSSPNGIQGFNNGSGGALSTVFTTAEVLTLNVEDTATYFCSTLNPVDLSNMDDSTNADPTHPPRHCPLPPGPFSFSSKVKYGASTRALTTLSTRLRVVDPAGLELLCIDVLSTTIDAALAADNGQMGEPNGHYGQAIYIFYVSIALAITYFLINSLARLTAAWGRRLYRSSGPMKSASEAFWGRAQSTGYILASAISGEKLGSSPALLRFCTPSAKDIVLHTQYCAILALIRVEWPGFVYPLLAQASWATLAYNITLSDSMPVHYNPTNPPSLSPEPVPYPDTFAAQFSDPTQPVYLDESVPNLFMVYPHNTTHPGLETFAYTLGVRPQDLFPLAAVVFLSAIGCTIAASILFWAIDFIGSSIFGSSSRAKTDAAFSAGGRSPPIGSKDGFENAATGGGGSNNGSVNEPTSLSLFRPPSKFGLGGLGGGERSATPGLSRGGLGKKRWWKRYIGHHSGLSSFHFSVLHGNLVRLVTLFHLPLTIFSSYHMILPVYQDPTDEWEIATTPSLKALAGLSFAIFSLVAPAYLIFRLFNTPTNKLFSETRTLSSLGPLYNLYSQGNQTFPLLYFGTNLVFGTVLGASQGATPSTPTSSDPGRLGLAQAIVLLICDIVSAVVTSVWLPWGLGAGMGLWTFLVCVGRIVVAVMVLILSSTVSIGPGPGSWVAYGILVLVALQYLAFACALSIKLIEGTIRILTRQPFRNSTTSLNAGLLGVCCTGRNKKKRPNSISSRRPLHRYTTTSEGLLTNQGPHQLHSLGPPPPLGAGGQSSSIRSGRSGPPPSVLRPAQAYKEYDSEEDAKEESSRPGSAGFIMGAWKPEGYDPVSSETEPPVASPPTPKASGFSRVGGGRAKMDNPYSALPPASPTPASASDPRSGSQTSFSLASPDPPASSTAVPSTSLMTSAPPSSFPPSLSPLPPGAAQPASPSGSASGSGAGASHVRTKSQTAIVEHFAQVIPQPTSNLAAYSTPVFVDDDNDDGEQSEGATQGSGRKKGWTLFGKRRGASAGALPASSSEASRSGDDMTGRQSLGDHGASASEGANSPPRSFVVIRKGQPQQGSSSLSGK